jgi:hypothetical protein
VRPRPPKIRRRGFVGKLSAFADYGSNRCYTKSDTKNM